MHYASDLEFHYELLEAFAKRLKPSLYVGFGIASGACIRRVAVHCHRAIGVDIDEHHPGDDYEFFHGTTEEFARRRLPDLPPVEMAFIDADHRRLACLRDFELLLPHVAENGLVLMHDTYPEGEQWLADTLCSDAYGTAEEISERAMQYGVEIVTLPIPPGISIVRKRKRHLHWTPPAPSTA